MSAIKPRPALTLDTGGLFRAARMGVVNFGRINIIANAVDHGGYLVQLRMDVNRVATVSQNKLQLFENDHHNITLFLPHINHRDRVLGVYAAPP